MSINLLNNKFVNLEKYYDFKDVLILPKSSNLNSRSEVNLLTKLEFNNGQTWEGIPIIAANMTTTGTFEVYDVLSKYKIITALHKFYTLNDYLLFKNERIKALNPIIPNYFMVSTGISDSDFKNLNEILQHIECKFILIDVANGYINNLKEYVKKVRQLYPDKIIVAGNISTKEGIRDLAECGVDIIKAGIGGGSACTTRIQTGIGMPQLSCVMECSEEAYSKSAYIISDGGITCPGDVAKAFGGGADFVMIGGEFSGHDENPGDLIKLENGECYKFFYGMSSSYAMKNNYATNNNTHYRSSEGREIRVKYKGKLANTVQNYLGGLRSTCTYTNCANLSELYDNTRFILVNNQYNNNLVNGK